MGTSITSTSSPLRALRGWLGNGDADCRWLTGRLGDVYPHETVIGHIRRALNHRFPRSTPSEICNRFKSRLQRVADYMNSNEFAARDGGGLGSLAASLYERCSRVSALQGERLRS